MKERGPLSFLPPKQQVEGEGTNGRTGGDGRELFRHRLFVARARKRRIGTWTPFLRAWSILQGVTIFRSFKELIIYVEIIVLKTCQNSSSDPNPCEYPDEYVWT
jgi:hypothetical protein